MQDKHKMIKMTHLFKLRVDYSFSKEIFPVMEHIKKIYMKIIGRFFYYYVTNKG